MLIRQLSWELAKLFGKKRTWLGFGVFIVLELLVLFLLNLPKTRGNLKRIIETNGYGFESYFSGTTLALQMVIWTIFLLGGLYLSLVGGDIVSKEVEDGTMRMALCRPISRLRLLLIKYITCVIYTFTLVFFIGLSALAAATLYRGYGGFFALQPMIGLFEIYPAKEGLIRYLLMLPFLSLSLLSITTLSFSLSCLNMKPAAATISSLSYFLADMILHQIPYFESIKTWFLSAHMQAWYSLIKNQIPVESTIESYAYLMAINATLLIVGATVFCQRDFKS